jgi:hypothetical protein
MIAEPLTRADDVRTALTEQRGDHFMVFTADGILYRVMRLRYTAHRRLDGAGLDPYTALLILPAIGDPILLERPADDRHRWSRFAYERAGHNITHWPAVCALLNAFGWTRRDRDEQAALTRLAQR